MSLNNDPNILFNIQSPNGGGNQPSIPVDVLWGGVSIATITGPAPFIDISTEMNRSENGKPQSITTNITLTGKIARLPVPTGLDSCRDRALNPASLGISGVLGSVSGLRNLFESCPTSSLKVVCTSGNNGQTALFDVSGVKFQSLNIEKGNDNWTRTADFTISLQHEKPTSNDPDEQVTDKSDTWTIEPLDDAVYTKFDRAIEARPEWSNPNVKDPEQDKNKAATRLRILSVPQFRITRRLSAKGIPIQSGSGSGTGCDPSGTGEGNFYLPSFISAKLWVDKQTRLAFAGSGSGGEPYFTSTPNLSEFKSTWLYNYNRTVNIDVSNATYEATDTWIAMPTGMPYTETYSIESSTNLEMIKTVRVAGNIQGLSFTPFSVMTGSGYLPSGSGKDNPISLAFSLVGTSGGPLNPVHNIPDVANDQKSNIGSLDSGRYSNAVSGWIYDIKPYLYRRACLVINGQDKTKPYVPAYSVTPPEPPENPIYSKEALLSVIPVSTSEGHDPRKGTITYNYEYNNKFNIISGTISENITISNDGPADLIAETQIPGRALGPIMQKSGSTAAKKTLNIEITVMAPTGIAGFFVQNPSCPLYTGGYIYGIINKLVEGVKPFGKPDVAVLGSPYGSTKNQTGQVFVTSDQDTWSPTQGRYTRTVSWTYQQCSNARFYLDH